MSQPQNEKLKVRFYADSSAASTQAESLLTESNVAYVKLPSSVLGLKPPTVEFRGSHYVGLWEIGHLFSKQSG